MELTVFLESTVPDNIKNIDLVKRCTEIFSEMLMANSAISYKISRLFDIDSTGWHRDDGSGLREVSFYEKDSEGNYRYPHILEARENLKKGLLYTYLNVVFRLLEIVCANPDVIRMLDRKSSTGSNLNKNPYDIVNSEYLGAFRYFQQSSGTEAAIRYIYRFSRYLESGENDDDLELQASDVFYLGYRGALHKSVFSNFNHPMAHPCGWCLSYDTVARMVLSDYYGLKMKYSTKYVSMFKGGTVVHFGRPTPGMEVTVVMPENVTESSFAESGIYVVPLDIKKINITEFTEVMFNGYSLLSTDRVSFGTVSSRVVFTGFTLIQPDISDVVITTEYTDTFELSETLEPSSEKDAHYFSENFGNAFRLVGENYPFVPGIDESRHKVQNDTNVLEKFTLEIPYRIQNLTYISLEDDFGHKFARVLENAGTLRVRTHGFYGEYLTFRAMDGLGYNYDHFLRTNLLNRQSSSLTLSNFSITGNRLKFSVSSTERSLVIMITVNGVPSTQSYGNSASIDIDTSAYPKYCEFSVKITDYNDEIDISGNGLNNSNGNFYFAFPKYPSGKLVSPRYTNCTPDTMNGIATGTKLRFLNESGPMIKGDVIFDDPVLETKQGSMKISELNPKNHRGVCYIGRGFEKVPSETADCLNPACTKYMSDSFEIGSTGYDTFLTFTNPEADGSRGKFLVCRFNNDTQESVVRGLLIGCTLLFTSAV